MKKKQPMWPDKGLGQPVRPFSDTFSAATVLMEMFPMTRDDIVSRLREQPAVKGSYGAALRDEAAEEIERLRTALQTISRGKSDGLDHAEDVRRLERAIEIARTALRIDR